jgi:hypothetical protein
MKNPSLAETLSKIAKITDRKTPRKTGKKLGAKRPKGASKMTKRRPS